MESVRAQLPDGIELIDVEMFGIPELSCSYVVHGAQTALIETGPATVFETLRDKLEQRRIEVDHIVLSHIHLDHGGGVGHVAELFGGATVWVHDIGARHLVDPTRLVSSARRLFGDSLDRLYGEPEPVDEPRIKIMDEGTRIPLGDRELTVLYTPGHARHEVTIFDPDTGCAFVGDTAGVCYGDHWQKPASPPPEFDLDAALDSITKVKRLRAEALCFTHYGPGVESTLDQAATDLRRWDAQLRPMVERGADDDELFRAAHELTGQAPKDDTFREGVSWLSSNENSALGFARYYRKHVLGD